MVQYLNTKPLAMLSFTLAFAINQPGPTEFKTQFCIHDRNQYGIMSVRAAKPAVVGLTNVSKIPCI